MLKVGSDNTDTTFIGTIQDGLSQTSFFKDGTGTLTLTGASTYTGATTINGGTLEADGMLANTSSVLVNAGGTLSGIGTIDPTTTTIMSGGTLAPAIRRTQRARSSSTGIRVPVRCSLLGAGYPAGRESHPC